MSTDENKIKHYGNPINWRAWRPYFLGLLMGFMASPRLLRAESSALPAIPDPRQRKILLEEVGFDQHLGKPVDLSLSFKDESDNFVKLGELIAQDRPVLLVLAYYECPNLCSLVLNGLFQTMNRLPYKAGRDYSLIVVSINPDELPSLAAAKKKAYLQRHQRMGGDKGINFLTGTQAAITQLAEQIGFRYAYDEKSGEYAHAAGATLLTAKGIISRYIFGVEFPERDLRLALVEVSQQKIGSPVDQFLLQCYRYDPERGSYAFAIQRTIRIAGIGIILFLILLIGGYLRAELKANQGGR